MTLSRGFADVATASLEALRVALATGRVGTPVTLFGLRSLGLGTATDAVAAVLAGLDADAARLVVDVALAERRHRPPPHLDLVWTGPDAPASRALDTAVVVERLFATAASHVLVAGYAFDHGETLMRHLFEGIRDRGLRVDVFFDLDRLRKKVENESDPVRAALLRFQKTAWPFGPPYPELYFDPRSLASDEYTSMHAKHAVIDSRVTLLTSANFTERGHARNIEAGVLIDDREFASMLVGQWRNLVSRGLMTRVSADGSTDD